MRIRYLFSWGRWRDGQRGGYQALSPNANVFFQIPKGVSLRPSFPCLPLSSLQQRDGLTFAMFYLIHCALARRFVRAPAQKSCAVPESAAGEMIVGNFNDNLWIDGLPFASALCAPATRSSRGVACESRWFLQRFKFFC